MGNRSGSRADAGSKADAAVRLARRRRASEGLSREMALRVLLGIPNALPSGAVCEVWSCRRAGTRCLAFGVRRLEALRQAEGSVDRRDLRVRVLRWRTVRPARAGAGGPFEDRLEAGKAESEHPGTDSLRVRGGTLQHLFGVFTEARCGTRRAPREDVPAGDALRPPDVRGLIP